MLPQSQDDALEMVRYLLGFFNLSDLPVTVRAHTQNWVFDTVMPDGQKAIIRVKSHPSYAHAPGTPLIRRAENVVMSEDAWNIIPVDTVLSSTCEYYALRTLTHNSLLTVPHPLKILNYGASELVIFAYVPGENRTLDMLTPRDAALAGAFLAQLHTKSRRLIFRGPTDPSLNAEGLLGPTSRYASPDEAHLLSDADRNILATLKQRVADIETLIGPQDEHTLLLHGDFLLQNIVFDGDTVGALDFEMCGWGTDLYDMATFLWQIKPSPRYDTLADAFWRGYTIWRELPPRDWLEIFIAARQGASVRWLIQNRHLPAYAERYESLIRQRLDEIAGFLETGMLKRD